MKKEIRVNPSNLMEQVKDSLLIFDKNSELDTFGGYKSFFDKDTIILSEVSDFSEFAASETKLGADIKTYLPFYKWRNNPVLELYLMDVSRIEEYKSLYSNNIFGESNILIKELDSLGVCIDNYYGSEETSFIAESEDGYRSGGTHNIKMTRMKNASRKNKKVFGVATKNVLEKREAFKESLKKIVLFDFKEQFGEDVIFKEERDKSFENGIDKKFIRQLFLSKI